MGRFTFVSFGLLVVFLSLSGTGADFDCIPGWSAYDRYCYQAFSEPKNWEDAESFCEEGVKTSHLVSIESSGEGDFVAQLVAEKIKTSFQYVWIGLRIQNKEQQCRSEWSDASSVNYENLYKQSSKKCYALKKGTELRTWFNVYCGRENPFVCKYTPEC
ncbi:snaclec mucetin subunit alpha-like [Protobothrops mucrosquamatus]|uniref:snaclec mucetin subunit alpha-like n=1 Tax=Protobothrops mucrosquamatus TaxID=103944 RepID=UPI000775710B|nr:snaclec mucetin subunit alpha-like [Protobothrops mucrosquamatus]